MRKITLSITLLLLTLGAQAYTVDTTASYIYSSDYNQAHVGASVPVGMNVLIGLEGKYVEDKLSVQDGGLKDPVYSVYLPIKLDFDLFRLHVTPFYYLKNDLHTSGLKDAYAYGINSQFIMDLVTNDVDELYSQAYIGVSYARQKAITVEEASWQQENYNQFAFSLGLRQNFYNFFTIQVAGTVFQYPDGISRIEGFQGILDNKDLAFTQSFDVNRALSKYILSARMIRSWTEKQSSIYAAYHYAEAYTADPEHSIIIGNTFPLAKQAALDIAYNHLQNTDGTNKRDLVYAMLHIAF